MLIVCVTGLFGWCEGNSMHSEILTWWNDELWLCVPCIPQFCVAATEKHHTLPHRSCRFMTKPATLHLYAWQFTPAKIIFGCYHLINAISVLWQAGREPKAAAALEFANGRPLKEPFMSHWEAGDYSYLSGEKRSLLHKLSVLNINWLWPQHCCWPHCLLLCESKS